MKNKPETIELKGKVLKARLPDKIGQAPVILMLHGLTGDESSMWVFANQIGQDSIVIAPRAPFKASGAGLSGYSWVNLPAEVWPTFQDFFPAVDWLTRLLEDFDQDHFNISDQPLKIFGFSQGGAMSFVYSMVHRARVSRVGLLSSFLPDSSAGFLKPEEDQNFPNFFLGHGEQDNIVPVEMAQEAYQALTRQGYSVQLCLTDVGHRLGAECFAAFRSFMQAE
jgi:phospholipase/carboxylesterase